MKAITKTITMALAAVAAVAASAQFVHSVPPVSGTYAAQRGIYEAEGRWFERLSKFYARQQYQSATGCTFDPSNPPSYGTSDSEHWNAAKRIYDILGE